MPKDAAVRGTTFRVGSSFALPQVIRSLGHSPEVVFAAARVNPDLYRNPENRIAVEDLGRLFACAAEITGRQDIGLLVTSSFRPGGLGLVGLLAAEGPDVNTALRNVERLLQFNTLAGYPGLSVNDGVATMRFDLKHSDCVGAEFILEGATGIIFRLLQSLCGQRWTPEEVRLTRREPANSQPYRDFFGGSIRFSSTEDSVSFSSDWLTRNVPREEKRVEARQLQIVRAPFSERVRRQVTGNLGLNALDAQTVADSLGVSRRQLFRQLSAEGATFDQIAGEVKFSRARHLLRSGDAPITEIAFALGYSDHSSFTRAFSRWLHISPAEWRRRSRENP